MGKLKKEVSLVVKQKNPKNRRNKTTLVFDEKARQDYLTGFSKRKQERKKKGQDEVIAKLKDEKKQIKYQRRKELDEKWSKLNLQCNLDNLAEATTYHLPKHTVTVSDISEIDMAGSTGYHLGVNKFTAKAEKNISENTNDDNNTEESLDEKPTKENHRSKKWKNQHKNFTHLMSKQTRAKKNKVMKRLHNQAGPQQRIMNKSKQKKKQKKYN